MKDFYNNNKKLCLIIAALLLFALCRMAIYDRRYYVSQNKVVVINRVTGYTYEYPPHKRYENNGKHIYRECGNGYRFEFSLLEQICLNAKRLFKNDEEEPNNEWFDKAYNEQQNK